MNKKRATRSVRSTQGSTKVSADDSAAILTELALTGPAPYLIRRLHQMPNSRALIHPVFENEYASQNHFIIYPIYASISYQKHKYFI